MEEKIYLLSWDMDDTNIDTYGSKIKYLKNGSVYYENILQPSGKSVHFWETKSFNISGNKKIPQLLRNELYLLNFIGETTPEQSLGLKVTTFNSSDEMLKQKMTLENDLEFKLLPIDLEFKIDLVKFNNAKFIFKGILLTSKRLQQNILIKEHLNEGYIDFIPKELGDNKQGETIIQTFHRAVDNITLPSSKLSHPVRVILLRKNFTVTYFKELIKEFKTEFKVDSINFIARDEKAKKLIESLNN